MEMKPIALRLGTSLVFVVLASLGIWGWGAQAATEYRPVKSWPRLPAGSSLGSPSAITVDRDDRVWTFALCGGEECVVSFDTSGNHLKSFGAGLFVFPHAIYVDKDRNVWAVDGMGQDGKGQQVIKFSPDGKVLMRLGQAGVAGDGPDTFSFPAGVVVASNGDIFVADGHGGETNARIVKFSRDGRFVKAWGKKGSGPGEFDSPHAIAMDSRGRLFVVDRNNVRIQIFDQDGKFLEEWKQFGRPSGIFIDAKDNIYVSGLQLNPGIKLSASQLQYGSRIDAKGTFEQGIRIGSARDGVVKVLIPNPGPATDPVIIEALAADSKGNVYGAEPSAKNVTKYVKD